STSESLAATPKAVKAAMTLLTGNILPGCTTAQKGIVQLSSAPTAHLKRLPRHRKQ
ncbi:hypothetical protein ECO7815_04380, partial [Escherichia coli O55:H7 str. 3256-97]